MWCTGRVDKVTCADRCCAIARPGPPPHLTNGKHPSLRPWVLGAGRHVARRKDLPWHMLMSHTATGAWMGLSGTGKTEQWSRIGTQARTQATPLHTWALHACDCASSASACSNSRVLTSEGPPSDCRNSLMARNPLSSARGGGAATVTNCRLHREPPRMR